MLDVPCWHNMPHHPSCLGVAQLDECQSRWKHTAKEKDINISRHTGVLIYWLPVYGYPHESAYLYWKCPKLQREHSRIACKYPSVSSNSPDKNNCIYAYLYTSTCRPKTETFQIHVRNARSCVRTLRVPFGWIHLTIWDESFIKFIYVHTQGLRFVVVLHSKVCKDRYTVTSALGISW